MAVVDALGLDRPVVIGCSIGGRVVLHLALEHAQTLPRADRPGIRAPTPTPTTISAGCTAPTCTAEKCAAAWSPGLIAPTAPEADRWETIWHYMQGGPGVFKGDLHYYTSDGDVRDRVAEIDTRACPLYFLTGEYDYSCTPADTRDLAAASRARTSPSWKGSATSPSARTRRASSATCGPCSSASWHEDAQSLIAHAARRSRLGSSVGRRLLLGESDVVARRRDRLAAPRAVEARQAQGAEGNRQALHAFAVVMRCRLPELHLLPDEVLRRLALAGRAGISSHALARRVMKPMTSRFHRPAPLSTGS